MHETLTWVITGGARGIGAEVARLVVARGGRVAIVDRDTALGERLAAELAPDESGAARFFECDLTDLDAVAELPARVTAAFDGVDVVLNNAGVADSGVEREPEHPLGLVSVAAFERVQQINVTAAYACSVAFVDVLRESDNPSIINALSIASFAARPRTTAYGASKAALAGLTRSLALDLAPYGIRVNGYAPGFTMTDMARNYLATAPDGALQAISENYLTSGPGTAVDIAEVAWFLASSRARFVNGVAWPVDGGFGAWKASPEELPAPPRPAAWTPEG